MLQQALTTTCSKLFRLAPSGLLLFQAVIGTVAIDAIASMTSGSGYSKPASQDIGEKFQKANKAVVLIKTEEGSGSGGILKAKAHVDQQVLAIGKT